VFSARERLIVRKHNTEGAGYRQTDRQTDRQTGLAENTEKTLVPPGKRGTRPPYHACAPCYTGKLAPKRIGSASLECA